MQNHHRTSGQEPFLFREHSDDRLLMFHDQSKERVKLMFQDTIRGKTNQPMNRVWRRLGLTAVTVSGSGVNGEDCPLARGQVRCHLGLINLTAHSNTAGFFIRADDGVTHLSSFSSLLRAAHAQYGRGFEFGWAIKRVVNSVLVLKHIVNVTPAVALLLRHERLRVDWSCDRCVLTLALASPSDHNK